jgi:hypothetical protein
METLWAHHPCDPGLCLGGAVGSLRVWIMRHPLDWSVSAQPLSMNVIEPLHPLPPPEHAEWRRFVAPMDSTDVRLIPVMPDRPLIMRPAVPVKILPGHTAHFFVTLPVWLRIEVAGARPAVLCELPTQTLSKSWSGEGTAEGEICYALRTRARQTLNELADSPGRAVCPVTLRNESNDLLPFTRLCLHTHHMAVYGTPGGRLWTNLTTVIHKDSLTPEQVTFADGPPSQADRPMLLCPPRKVVSHLFSKSALGGLLSFQLTGVRHA